MSIVYTAITLDKSIKGKPRANEKHSESMVYSVVGLEADMLVDGNIIPGNTFIIRESKSPEGEKTYNDIYYSEKLGWPVMVLYVEKGITKASKIVTGWNVIKYS